MLARLFAVRRARSLLFLLKQERLALLNGNFSDLPNSHRRKTRLLDLLEQDSLPKDARLETLFEEIRKTARANERLIQASRRGMTEAQRRLDELTGKAMELRTYTGKGEKIVLGTPFKGHEKRS